jgi:hypothetical protein
MVSMTVVKSRGILQDGVRSLICHWLFSNLGKDNCLKWARGEKLPLVGKKRMALTLTLTIT